jgi:hypothetical protein
MGWPRPCSGLTVVSRDVRLEKADGGPSSNPRPGPLALDVIPAAALPKRRVDAGREAE